ncbi:MAG: hypothetical protein R3331_00275 [Sulfurospirillaceae bacterium]|nr:hypothetical protein [Sulfurospirillaceae bacterium]
MAVKFISTIKENGIGGWCIELVDTLDDTRVLCNSIEEYESAIEKMGEEYANDIEVQWHKDDNVTKIHMDEVRIEISKFQKLIDKKMI